MSDMRALFPVRMAMLPDVDVTSPEFLARYERRRQLAMHSQPLAWRKKRIEKNKAARAARRINRRKK